MNRMIGILLLMFSLAQGGLADDIQSGSDKKTAPLLHNFTGDQLTVLYVTDVLRSARFYSVLGFELDHYYDYQEGEYYKAWPFDRPPGWAQVNAGPIRIGLTLAETEDERRVANTRHYFIVKDVDEHYRAVTAHGLNVTPIEDRPWMRFFDVADLDGHTLVFGTRNPEHTSGLD